MTNGFDRLKTALSDRYTIERELGSGGMATVYLAEDLKHRRRVAIKVLRPELAAAIGAERFLREIEITAKLNHPHILPLLDSGEADGFLFYVMPHVEGESLRDRLQREKQLPIEDALKIAIEVADALGSAHRHNVIHRDIKPGNILLEEGHAVVADFGVARAIEEAGETRLTETGIAIGTPAYLSPEQAGGERELDGRSDVYSLGCVLYEMLAGEPPFTGPTAESIVHQHLTAEPPSVTTRRAAAPIELADALKKALAKTPADRFATAEQFADTLTVAPTVPRPAGMRPAAVRERVRRNPVAYAAVAILAIIGAYTIISRTVGRPEPMTAAEGPRIAVLPFANLGSSEDEWFADGITEEITSRIAEISGLHVISRTSAMQYESHEKTLRQVGEELGVDYVLEGTIRTDRAPDASGQVRVTPQLIRISDDAHLWTDRYTANLAPGEIFGVQEQIANEVAEALDVTLLEPERQRLAGRPTDNQEAYEYFLRGVDYANRGAEEQYLRNAVQMWQKAVELDPDFALAYAWLCRAHSKLWWHFYDHTQERLAMAKEAVDEALRLNPDLPEAHLALGQYYYWAYLDYDRALAEFATAQRSQPNRVDLIYVIAHVQRRQGKFVEAVANYRKATELDPRMPTAAFDLALTYIYLRNPAEAARYFDRAISLSPDWAEPYWRKAWVYLALEGSPERARAVLEEAQSVGLASARLANLWVLVEMWDGDYQEALDRLAGFPSEINDQLEYVSKAQLYAQIFGLRGNRQLERAHYDSARTILETEVREHPDDDRYRSALGIAYAGLGRREDAIREGESAVELLPISKDAIRGAHRVQDLASIYTMVGEYDEAIDQLEILLAVPSLIAVPMLRIDPTWNPLRDQPRFQALLEKYGN